MALGRMEDRANKEDRRKYSQAIYRPPPLRHSNLDASVVTPPANNRSSDAGESNRRQRRPDMQVYVPRGRRLGQSNTQSQQPQTPRAPSPALSTCSEAPSPSRTQRTQRREAFSPGPRLIGSQQRQGSLDDVRDDNNRQRPPSSSQGRRSNRRKMSREMNYRLAEKSLNSSNSNVDPVKSRSSRRSHTPTLDPSRCPPRSPTPHRARSESKENWRGRVVPEPESWRRDRDELRNTQGIGSQLERRVGSEDGNGLNKVTQRNGRNGRICDRANTTAQLDSKNERNYKTAGQWDVHCDRKGDSNQQSGTAVSRGGGIGVPKWTDAESWNNRTDIQLSPDSSCPAWPVKAARNIIMSSHVIDYDINKTVKQSHGVVGKADRTDDRPVTQSVAGDESGKSGEETPIVVDKEEIGHESVGSDECVSESDLKDCKEASPVIHNDTKPITDEISVCLEKDSDADLMVGNDSVDAVVGTRTVDKMACRQVTIEITELPDTQRESRALENTTEVRVVGKPNVAVTNQESTSDILEEMKTIELNKGVIGHNNHCGDEVTVEVKTIVVKDEDLFGGSVNMESDPSDVNITVTNSKDLRKVNDEAPLSSGADSDQDSTKDSGRKSCKKFDYSWADDDEDSWDALYDDSGDCLQPHLLKEVKERLGNVEVSVPSSDYLSFPHMDAQLDEQQFSHVIEVYGFPAAFKTQDLMSAFGTFHATGFDIKWVDDTHALGVFSTPLCAAEALQMQHPMVRTRPMSQATTESRRKASRITEFLQPYKPRPETNASLARRLVTGALGVKTRVSREVREVERKRLQEAKDRKKLAARQRTAAWEGTIADD